MLIMSYKTYNQNQTIDAHSHHVLDVRGVQKSPIVKIRLEPHIHTMCWMCIIHDFGADSAPQPGDQPNLLVLKLLIIYSRVTYMLNPSPVHLYDSSTPSVFQVLRMQDSRSLHSHQIQ